MGHHSLYKRPWTPLKFLSSTSPSPESLNETGKCHAKSTSRHSKLPWVLAFRLEALKAMHVPFSAYHFVRIVRWGSLVPMLQTAGLSASWPQVSHCKTSTSGFERRWSQMLTNVYTTQTAYLHQLVPQFYLFNWRYSRIARILLRCLAPVSFISHWLAALGTPCNRKLHIMAAERLRQIWAV